MNVVFIRPTKVAGTSIIKALNLDILKSLNSIRLKFRNHGRVNFGHMDYALLVKEQYVSEGFDKSAFKFSFVRNPYDRAVSLYFFLGRQNRATFKDFCRRVLSKPMKKIGLYNNNATTSLCNPQARWLKGVKLDFVGRFEALTRDFAKLTSLLNLGGITLPRLRAGKHKHYSEYYDCNEVVEIVQKVYREDFEQYGYSM